MPHYAEDAPSGRTLIDLFKGEWSSRFPASLGIDSGGTAGLFEDERITWALGQLSAHGLSIAHRRVLEVGPPRIRRRPAMGRLLRRPAPLLPMDGTRPDPRRPRSLRLHPADSPRRTQPPRQRPQRSGFSKSTRRGRIQGNLTGGRRGSRAVRLKSQTGSVSSAPSCKLFSSTLADQALSVASVATSRFTLSHPPGKTGTRACAADFRRPRDPLRR